MDLTSLLLIAVGLSADCFAVTMAVSISAASPSSRRMLRTALAFGVAQTLMTAIGWAVGSTIVDFIASYDHWVAFGLLAVIGGRMLWESLHSEESEAGTRDATRGLALLVLAVATSIDALAVGLSFAFLEVNIALAALTIGGVAFAITALGFLLGRKAGHILGEWAEAVGGLILIGIGLRILLTHIL
ncbi:MAG: manganese efflux pump [Chloroflexi bacterium]|nr:manganese efflux pump [Chloroflexota bacterium]